MSSRPSRKRGEGSWISRQLLLRCSTFRHPWRSHAVVATLEMTRINDTVHSISRQPNTNRTADKICHYTRTAANHYHAQTTTPGTSAGKQTEHCAHTKQSDAG